MRPTDSGDTRPAPWHDYTAGIELRDYQERTLQRFRQRVDAQGERSFYLVAPPGAGKTLLGLLMAEHLGAPAVCLAPNAAIQQQWLERLAEHWVCTDTIRGAFAPHPACSDEVAAEPQALVAFTYQRLAVRGRDGERHPNVQAAHTALRRSGVGTVILDECHHLSAEWGAAVEELCAALGAPHVIGLTATPVAQEQGPLARLLGTPDHEVSLPSVIRHGDLAPFQDLCHLVAPSLEEDGDLEGDLARFEALDQRLRATEEGRFSLGTWCDMLELEPGRLLGEPLEDLLELFQARRDLVIAWCRLRVAQGREPPAVLPYLPELFEMPTLHDRLLLAGTYGAHHLLDPARGPKEPAGGSEEPAAKDPGATASPRERGRRPQEQAAGVEDLARETVALLAEWGFELTPGRVSRRVGRIARRIGFSRRKLQAVVTVLRTELIHLGDELRALVITDYEFPPERLAALSCVDVMEILTASPDVDEVDPIMITGSSLLVDDDLWDRFRDTAAALCQQQGWELEITKEAERGYWRLSGSGPDWKTRVQVALVTHMLTEGISRCVVGTRSLLGEGWDCLRLNTLIDLTVVTSGVAVNQIRGRTLRRDPENPVKVANNWDVLCVSSLGDGTDLERLATKHDRLYGITDDGRVELGMGHLHARFDRVSARDLHAEREEINALMHRRATQRREARARWRVGEPYLDRDLHVLAFRPPRRRQEPPSTAAPAGRQRSPTHLQSQVVMRPRDLGRVRRQAQAAVAVSTAVGIGLGVAGLLLWGPAAFLAALPLAGGLLHLRRVSRRLAGVGGLAQELRSLGLVVAAAYARKEGPAVGVVVGTRDDGSLRVAWETDSTELSERLSAALAELVGPVGGQRYLLVEEGREVSGDTSLGRLFRPGRPVFRPFAVPRMFSRKRDAEILLEAWRRERNPAAAIVHRQSARGAALLRDHVHQRPLEGEAAIRAVWS